MERLTFDCNFCDICSCLGEPCLYLEDGGCDQKKVFYALKEYEDTNMTPSEIRDMKEMFHSYRHICAGVTPERIKELVEADREGRCVVMPYKVGTTVYIPIKNDWFEEVEENVMTECGERGFWISGVINNEGDFGIFYDWDEIGKTVFPIREAAEKALEAINGKE